MVRVLVTGGSGFIGEAIVTALTKKGHEIVIFDLCNTNIKHATFHRGSVLDPEAISKAMSGCDYVIHMAAVLGVSKSTYEPVECLDVNIIGTRNVLRCCVIHRIKKILLTSSSEVYGEPAKNPITENTVLQPKSEYGVSKWVGEEYLKAYKRQHGLEYTIVRYFNVYGERQRHSWVMSKFVNNAVLGKPLKVFGDGSQVRAFCHVQDAAEGTVAALLSEAANGEILNIGNCQEPLSMKELAERVIRAAGKSEPPLFIPLEHSDRTKEREIFQRIPATEKAKQLLGFEAKIHLDEGIRSVITYRRENLGETKAEVEQAERYEQLVCQNK